VFDVIPTGEALHRADQRLAIGYWPWSLLAQAAPLPERLIAADPAAIIDAALGGWGTKADSFSPQLRDIYIEALHDPASAHAICEEYRAAATLDFVQDEADRKAGRQIACPTLVLWGAKGPLDIWYAEAGGPLGIWRAWCRNVSGRPIEGGHFFPEQNPDETVAALRGFLAA
jgi:haloacetate dehalogenase